MRRQCLGCGTPTTGSRCPRCRAAQRSIYQGDWPRISREAIAAHVARHGWVCLGDAHHAAHATTDLTCDHVQPGSLALGVEVVCRAANSAKAHRRQ